jgi:hypothetical protein
MTFRQTCIFTVTFIALALCPVDPVRAQIIVYDGFDYGPSPGLTNVSILSKPDFSTATNIGARLVLTNPFGELPTTGGGIVVAGFSSGTTANDAQIQRGKYLVENVALCAECHTPKNNKGERDRTQWLQGDVLDIKPARLMPFAAVAPPITGMPGFTDAQALKFLETGIDLTGKPAMYPMPQYRFSHDDALAVLAYLRSLKH